MGNLQLLEFVVHKVAVVYLVEQLIYSNIAKKKLEANVLYMRKEKKCKKLLDGTK